jgi:hypothetical protein
MGLRMITKPDRSTRLGEDLKRIDVALIGEAAKKLDMAASRRRFRTMIVFCCEARKSARGLARTPPFAIPLGHHSSAFSRCKQ